MTTSISHPKVSIGLPVYNGGEQLRQALDDLLEQDYPNFELIISDNASTDNTWDICKEYAARDCRIHLYSNKSNCGFVENFNRTFTYTTGKYCLFVTHDDRWESNMISQCVEQLEAHPGAVLCFFNFRIYYAHKNEYKDVVYDADLLQDIESWQRINTILQFQPFPTLMIYSLFRRDILQESLPMRNALASDAFVVLEMIKRGPFTKVDKALFTKNEDARHFHKRPPTFGEKRVLSTALKWDFALLTVPLRIAWSVAPSLSIRLILLKTILVFFHQRTGWPIPYHVFNRYIYFILPEETVQKLVIWYRKLRGQELPDTS